MSKQYYIPKGTPGIKPEIHWNPLTGCDAEPISLGCDNCWARTMAYRFPACVEGAGFAPAFHHWWLDKLPKSPHVVCANFMGDWMANQQSPDGREAVHRRMVAGIHCGHIFLTLTKRPNKLEEFYRLIYRYEHIWLGVTAETQLCYDGRIDAMRQLQEAEWSTWLSLEPLLGPVDLRGIRWDWVVVGCESGPKRRPCAIKWIRDIVQQCDDMNVPCYVKQIDTDSGEVLRDWQQLGTSEAYRLWPADIRIRQYPKEFRARSITVDFVKTAQNEYTENK